MITMILKQGIRYAWEMLLPHTHTQHAAYKYCARANVPMNIVCINTTHVHIQLNKHILKQQNLNPTCNMLPSLQKYAYANMLWYTHCDTSLRRAEPTTEFHTRFAVLARPIAATTCMHQPCQSVTSTLHKHIYIHTRTHARTHARTRTHTHTHPTHTHHTHTHTHTHTH